MGVLREELVRTLVATGLQHRELAGSAAVAMLVHRASTQRADLSMSAARAA